AMLAERKSRRNRIDVLDGVNQFGKPLDRLTHLPRQRYVLLQALSIQELECQRDAVEHHGLDRRAAIEMHDTARMRNGVQHDAASIDDYVCNSGKPILVQLGILERMRTDQ